MACFFFYGTLMDAAVRRAVLGRDLPARAIIAAELPGWRRVYRLGSTYPVLVPVALARTDGIVVEGLTAEDGKRLSRFEGPDYRLGRVALVLKPRSPAAARAFLPVSAAIAGERPWDYGEWQRRHRRSFLECLERRGTGT
jgi:hypothetical protein